MILQILVFSALTLLIAGLTWWKCRKPAGSGNEARDYFLAGKSLTWVYVAGSLTLTNINTDTLVGWNGNQMLMVVWWELFGVAGLLLLAHVFLPFYYKYDCTTVTELLERNYGDKHLRAAVAVLFLIGNVLIFLPVMLYTSALFLKGVFDLSLPLPLIAAVVGVAGGLYAIVGGLRAVAISDTFSGVLILGMALLVAILALNAVEWNFENLPPERLAIIGSEDSLMPWSTLLTGMIFVQLYYWSTNQTITQRAMAATSLREAQKGCYAAAVIRATIVPVMVIAPGLCAYQLWGELGDATYGAIVKAVLPAALSGAFAAAMAAATMTSFNSTLNSSATLLICDLYAQYSRSPGSLRTPGIVVSILFTVFAILLAPAYAGADSIIQLIQRLIGLFSMPILSAFITGLLFRNVHPWAVMLSLIFGGSLYGYFSFVWMPAHFLHLMFITLICCVLFTLCVNRIVFKRKALPPWR